MFLIGRREVVLLNPTNAVIEIREVRHGLPQDRFGTTITLEPGSRMDMAASTFTRRRELSGRAAFLKIFVDGAETKTSLTPHDFIAFVVISFHILDDGPGLSIRGVRARLTDVSRFMCFRFLRRNYQGRPREDII